MVERELECACRHPRNGRLAIPHGAVAHPRLAHILEKWLPVFRKGYAPSRESGVPDDDRSVLPVVRDGGNVRRDSDCAAVERWTARPAEAAVDRHYCFSSSAASSKRRHSERSVSAACSLRTSSPDSPRAAPPACAPAGWPRAALLIAERINSGTSGARRSARSSDASASDSTSSGDRSPASGCGCSAPACQTLCTNLMPCSLRMRCTPRIV